MHISIVTSHCFADFILGKISETSLYIPAYFRALYYPVRIRVRIDPPHPLVCRKKRLNGEVLWMRPEKPRSRVTKGVAR
jgi:hypothetical protein